MDYLDFELCIGPGEGQVYPVSVVRSPAGERRASMTFPFDELDLKDQLQNLQIALLKSGGTRRDMVRPQEQLSVEDFGKALFGALLTDEIRSSYRISKEKAHAEGKGLRLRLRIEAPDLAALPWEFLYDEAEGDFICLSNETPIVRYLELDRPPEPIEIEPPLRVLGMIAAPQDRSSLDVAKEKQRMSEAIADLEARGLVELTWLEGQTWRDLQKAMRHGPWHVFHFVGHGGFDGSSGEGMLALADDSGATFRLPATKLGRLLADHRDLRLAVLNACEGAQASSTDVFSSTAAVLIRRGIPAVVAMQYEITDRAAIEFGHAFYESIAEGLPVDAAVGEARKSISLSVANTIEWGTPVLHMRAPDGRLFTIDPDAARTREPAPAPMGDGAPSDPLPAPPPVPPDPQPVSTPPDRKKLFMWGGAAAAVVALIAVFGLMSPFSENPGPNPEPGQGPVVDPAVAPAIGRVVLIPQDETVETGEAVRIAVSLLDPEGRGLNEQDLSAETLTWTVDPPGLATIEPSERGPGVLVRGEGVGTVTVTATVAGADGEENAPADTKRITVVPDAATLSAVQTEYIQAERRFNDPSVTNAEIAETYGALLADHGAALQESELITVEELEGIQGQLTGLVAQYDATAAADAADTLALGEERARWQAYLASADTVRNSPSTKRAAAIVDSLDALAATQATLLSLDLCTTGSVNCQPVPPPGVFTSGQSVYFLANVKLPRSERIYWRWHGPDGTMVDEGRSNTLPRDADGYRYYRNTRATDAPGRYELRLYNTAEHLIGRRTFVVE